MASIKVVRGSVARYTHILPWTRTTYGRSIAIPSRFLHWQVTKILSLPAIIFSSDPICTPVSSPRGVILKMCLLEIKWILGIAIYLSRNSWNKPVWWAFNSITNWPKSTTNRGYNHYPMAICTVDEVVTAALFNGSLNISQWRQCFWIFLYICKKSREIDFI